LIGFSPSKLFHGLFDFEDGPSGLLVWLHRSNWERS
jgi:hypothetical protein